MKYIICFNFDFHKKTKLMLGPFPIVCRAHSGGRLLSEIYIKNNIQMGDVHPKTKDTKYFAIRANNNAYHLITQSDVYHNLSNSGKAYFKNISKNLINDYLVKNNIDQELPFGWKFGETLFTLPPILESFPSTKAVHLIRDGRDVMLSRIPARFQFNRFHEAWNRLIVLGSKTMDSYNGEYVTEETIEKYRTEMELLHWVNIAKYSKKLRQYSNQYLEIRYEELCEYPEKTVDKISEYLGIPFNQASREWAKQNASTSRIGKWKNENPDHIERIITPHKSILKEFGYLD